MSLVSDPPAPPVVVAGGASAPLAPLPATPTHRVFAGLSAAVAILIIVGLVGARLLPVPVLVLSLPFLYLLARRPVLRRLALRNATRRPRETALVLLGSLLGTAIITGSLIVGDTLHDSIQRGAYTQLGPVDEAVFSLGTEGAAFLTHQVSTVPAGDIAGAPLALIQLNITAAAGRPDAPNPRAEPGATMYETDFAQARVFGGDPSLTGITGPTPSGSEAAVGTNLAARLGLHVGDNLTVYAYGRNVTFQVSRILPQKGIAGLSFYALGSRSYDLFVAPGTIAALADGTAGKGSPPTTVIVVHNHGGVISAAKSSATVVEDIKHALPPFVPALVQPVKQQRLDAATAQGQQFTTLFTGVGFFSVLAGLLLLINIFVMLGEERKTELGMLRALGLRRLGLVSAFSLEGWMYALGSSALGTVGGMGVGAVVALLAGKFFSRGFAFGLDVHYAAHAASVQTGFFFGFAISLATVVVTSVVVARLNVIRAIRDLPDPERQRHRWATVAFVVAGLIGALMTMAGVSQSQALPLLVGPVLVATAVSRLFGGFRASRWAVTLPYSAVVAWAVVAFSIVHRAFRGTGIIAFIAQGMVLTFAAIAVVSRNQDVIGSVLRRVGGGSHNMSLRLGLAYPLAKVFRTALILAMFTLVVFGLTFITVFSNLFSQQVSTFTRQTAGGYALTANSNATNPIPADAVRRLPGVRAVAPISVVDASMSAPLSQGRFVSWPAATFDRTWVDNGPPSLQKRDARFANDTEAYRDILTQPDDAIVPAFFLQQGGGPPTGQPHLGDAITVKDPVSGTARQLTVVAISESSFANINVLVHPDTMRQLFGSRAVANQLFVAVHPGVDGQALADRINGQFVANGADAASFHKQISERLGTQMGFFHLMQGYIALGLLVGIAGLGVVMVRAVRERRRQVGVLRALGFAPKAVRRAFMAESSFVAAEGVVLGAVLANVTAWRLVEGGGFGTKLAFSVPWVPVLLLVAGTFVASLIATAAPAQQASRIKPAVALRIAD